MQQDRWIGIVMTVATALMAPVNGVAQDWPGSVRDAEPGEVTGLEIVFFALRGHMDGRSRRHDRERSA